MCDMNCKYCKVLLVFEQNGHFVVKVCRVSFFQTTTNAANLFNRQQGLGAPIHIKTPSIVTDIAYRTLLVLGESIILPLLSYPSWALTSLRGSQPRHLHAPSTKVSLPRHVLRNPNTFHTRSNNTCTTNKNVNDAIYTCTHVHIYIHFIFIYTSLYIYM